MRLVTRSDFDGLVCAVLLKEKWVIWIAIAEMLGVLTILPSMASSANVNWLSLFAFILCTSAIAVSYDTRTESSWSKCLRCRLSVGV